MILFPEKTGFKVVKLYDFRKRIKGGRAERLMKLTGTKKG